MTSPAEIGHSRHRQALISEFRSIVDQVLEEAGRAVRECRHCLGSFDGKLLNHTSRDQTLQSYWKWDGGWIQVDVASTGEDWDALVIITSSGIDRDVIVPQRSSSLAARSALEEVLASAISKPGGGFATGPHS